MEKAILGNDIFEKFNEGELRLPGKTIACKDIAWSKHLERNRRHVQLSFGENRAEQEHQNAHSRNPARNARSHRGERGLHQ